jgi:hypothetical protein
MIGGGYYDSNALGTAVANLLPKILERLPLSVIVALGYTTALAAVAGSSVEGIAAASKTESNPPLNIVGLAVGVSVAVVVFICTFIWIVNRRRSSSLAVDTTSFKRQLSKKYDRPFPQQQISGINPMLSMKKMNAGMRGEDLWLGGGVTSL